MEITIKDNAREMLNAKLREDQFLRVTVVEGGCAGLTYGAEIAQEMQGDESVVFESGTVRVVSNAKNSRYLDGLVIDYSDDLINGGLKFTNSRTKSTCGCGQSFSLAGFPVADKGDCCK